VTKLLRDAWLVGGTGSRKRVAYLKLNMSVAGVKRYLVDRWELRLAPTIRVHQPRPQFRSCRRAAECLFDHQVAKYRAAGLRLL